MELLLECRTALLSRFVVLFFNCISFSTLCIYVIYPMVSVIGVITGLSLDLQNVINLNPVCNFRAFSQCCVCVNIY
jgi:hypothetical protein